MAGCANVRSFPLRCSLKNNMSNTNNAAKATLKEAAGSQVNLLF